MTLSELTIKLELITDSYMELGQDFQKYMEYRYYFEKLSAWVYFYKNNTYKVLMKMKDVIDERLEYLNTEEPNTYHEKIGEEIADDLICLLMDVEI